MLSKLRPYSTFIVLSTLLLYGMFAPRSVLAEDAKPPRGLSAVPIPKENSSSAEKIELGKQLYFDKRLSADDTVACASCHDPKKGWSNGEKTAAGVGGQRGGRSSPTVINSAYQAFQFWDGRAGSLEPQAVGPIANPPPAAGRG